MCVRACEVALETCFIKKINFNRVFINGIRLQYVLDKMLAALYLSLSLSVSVSLCLCLSLSLSVCLSLSLSLSHTHTHTRIYARAHTHTYTRALSSIYIYIRIEPSIDLHVSGLVWVYVGICCGDSDGIILQTTAFSVGFKFIIYMINQQINTSANLPGKQIHHLQTDYACK